MFKVFVPGGRQLLADPLDQFVNLGRFAFQAFDLHRETLNQFATAGDFVAEACFVGHDFKLLAPQLFDGLFFGRALVRCAGQSPPSPVPEIPTMPIRV